MPSVKPVLRAAALLLCLVLASLSTPASATSARAAGACADRSAPATVLACAAKAVNRGKPARARRFATKSAVRQMVRIKATWHYRYGTDTECDYSYDESGYVCTGSFWLHGRPDGYYTAFLQGTGSHLAVRWVQDSPHDRPATAG